jgi:hypothetical protein
MIPNRAGYGGKTRRTGKIHWQMALAALGTTLPP